MFFFLYPFISLRFYDATYWFIEIRNMFLFSEIIFDPFLVLNSYIVLLGFIFVDETFWAPNLMFVDKIGGLNIWFNYK
jgi:hypothetical protein